MNLEKEIFDISLVDIMPNRFQPREIFDDEALHELSASIKEHGVIQPIIVRKVGDKYEIIAGERRFRASQLAGKETIPALVREIDDKEAAKIALLENLQRKDLTPIEEAKTYQTILRLDNITQEELARNLGKSQSSIANKLRLLSLDEEVQTALLNSQISERHARSLLSLDNQKQKELLSKIINNRLTVRQVDEEIMKITGQIPDVSQEEMNNASSINLGDNINYNSSQNVITEPVVNQFDFNMPANNQLNPKDFVINQNEVYSQNQMPNIDQNEINNITQDANINIPNEMNIGMKSFDNMASVVPENETNFVNSSPDMTYENIPNEPMQQELHPNNIFERLRIENQKQEMETNFNNAIINNNELSNNDQSTIVNESVENQNNQQYGDIYDLRFAINNFRQAIQNTEKFGFKVNTEELDGPDFYQIVIKIDKNN